MAFLLRLYLRRGALQSGRSLLLNTPSLQQALTHESRNQLGFGQGSEVHTFHDNYRNELGSGRASAVSTLYDKYRDGVGFGLASEVYTLQDMYRSELGFGQASEFKTPHDRYLSEFGFGQGVNEVPHFRCGIATSARCNAEEEEPVRSPLSQAPGPLGSGGQKLGVSASKTALAVLTGIRQSPQKLNRVAEMVRGMRVEDALTQMAVSVKRAAKTVSKVVHSAQANAVHNFGLEKDRLVVSEAFVGKDRYLKRIMPHGKGKSGKMEHAGARLTVVVKEMSAEQETDLARLRVLRSRGTNMSRAEARLVPHRVLATQWSRQRTPKLSPLPEGAEPVGA